MSKRVLSIVTNFGHIPSEDRRKRIKRDIGASQSLLTKLDKDAKYLDKLEEGLKKKREQIAETIQTLQDTIVAQAAYIAPIRWLPDDLLIDIFLLCLPEHGYPNLALPTAPMTLTQVCQRWRKVAEATPGLWSKLRVEPIETNKWTSCNEDRYIQVSRWIKLAGATPLSISFQHSTSHRLCQTDVGRLLECLPSSPVIWNEFEASLIGSRDHVTKLLKGHGEGSPFRRARKLNLIVHVRSSAESSGFHLNQREGVHAAMKLLDLSSNIRLRELRLRCSNFKPHKTNFSSFLPCTHLKVLDLQDPENRPDFQIPGDVVCDLLRSCNNLVVFKADLEETDHNVTLPTSKFVMRRLEHMSLSLFEFSAKDDVETWFPFLEFPALERLHVRNRERITRVERRPPPESLHLVMETVGIALTSLELDPGILSRQDLLEALACTPALIQLHLKQRLFADDFDFLNLSNDMKYTDEVLERLTPTDDPLKICLCPRLQYLKWQFNTCFSDNALATLLVARSKLPRIPTAFKQVHVDFGRPMERDIAASCSSLIADGLVLSLEYLPDDEKDARNVIYGSDKRKFVVGAKKMVPIDEEVKVGGFGWT